MTKWDDLWAKPENADEMLKAAIEYAAHGWPVFPLRGKLPAKPRTEGGRGFHDATTDPAVVAAMWARYPDANVGVRCGLASGLAVVDIDPAHGGVDTLTRIEAERGVLPGTVTAITGGDGLHMLYRHRPGIGCGANVWGRGLDLRGEGSYIVAAPSIHPDTGNRYRWSGDGTWAHPLPAWPEEQLPTTRPVVVAPIVSPGVRAGQGPLAGLVTVVLEAAEGERNNKLNWAAYKAGEHVRAGRLEIRVAASALHAAAILVGLSEREAIATISSGLGARAVA